MSDLSSAAVWIVEDDADYREAVSELLGDHGAAVEAFGSVEAALARADVFASGGGPSARAAAPEAGWPEVVLLDVNLPGLSGIEGVAEIKARIPATAIVMLTIRDDDKTIYAALGAGASGYLLKSAAPEEILGALREARTGGMLMQRQVARLVLAAFEARTPVPDYGLTRRETDVLREMVGGHTQPQIADRLFVSLSTVNSHVQSVYRKLHVHNGSAAVSKAVRERLVE
ncbi:MAG: response regulator transcription factor [Bacteroidota bacterium]